MRKHTSNGWKWSHSAQSLYFPNRLDVSVFVCIWNERSVYVFKITRQTIVYFRSSPPTERLLPLRASTSICVVFASPTSQSVNFLCGWQLACWNPPGSKKLHCLRYSAARRRWANEPEPEKPPVCTVCSGLYFIYCMLCEFGWQIGLPERHEPVQARDE